MVALLVAGLGVGVVALSRPSGPPAAPAPPPPVAAAGLALPTAGLVVPQAAPILPVATAPTGSIPQAAAAWAGRLAAQVGIPADELAAYGRAELAMRERVPDCHLSWTTLAGVGRVRYQHRMGDDAFGSLSGTLCGDHRDLATMAGWLGAIRTVAAGDTATLEKILAATSIYASSSRPSGGPSPEARRALDFAVDQVGLPYVWGGNGPGNGQAGFDCSGLTTAAYAAAGVLLPRTADSQYRAVALNPPDQPPQPGDLVFYGDPARFIHHVGLYLGGDVIINAPTFGMAVQLGPLRQGDYAGSGRPAPAVG